MREPRPSRWQIPVLSALLLLTALPAAAGQRHTVWAYPPGAGPKGVVEAETWITTSRASSDQGTAAEYRIEIENGLSDDVSLDLYLGVFRQAPGEAIRFDSVQASLRADLVRDPLAIPVDLTGYFELKRDVDFSTPWEFEAILIGGKSFGRFSYSFNLVYESELSSNAFRPGVREVKGIVTAGYELTKKIWAGAELVLANAAGAKEASLGPTLSFGLTGSTWVAIGPQFGLNHDTDDLKVRAIFGIFF